MELTFQEVQGNQTQEDGNGRRPFFIAIMGLIAVAVLAMLFFSFAAATSRDWTLVSMTTQHTAVSAHSATVLQSAAWRQVSSGMTGDLPSAEDFCNQFDIKDLTGAPCEWVVEEARQADGAKSFRIRLRSGDYTIAEAEASELSVAQFEEVAHAASQNPAYTGIKNFWFSRVAVAEWARTAGIGRFMWDVLNQWLATNQGEPVLRYIADGSKVGWVPSLLERATSSGAVTQVTEIATGVWMFLVP